MSKVRNKKTNFNAIGKLLRFAKPYVPAIFLALFFSILQIVATLFAPVIIGKTVDFIIGKDNVDFSVIAKNADTCGAYRRGIAVPISQFFVHKLRVVQNDKGSSPRSVQKT